jgi:EmrB/QacA subfamily drug resistance transporter
MESTSTQSPANPEFATKLPPKKDLVLIVAGLMTGLLLGAIDQTIVATAGPTIIADLKGLSVYAWVFSAYILTQTVAMPVFGKLSDLYGRKKFFLLGLVIFIVGSILSGAAQDINQLIIFRAIQGIGSGAFFPVAIAVVGVVFPPALRGRVQGIFSTVFGIAAVVGPLAGAAIVDSIGWRWIFYVNLPLGIASIVAVLLGLRESKATGPRPVIDWTGISLLTAWVALLSFGFLGGGSTFPWYSWQELAVFTSVPILFALFVLVERRAAEPVLPLSMFRIRTVSSASAVSFLRGIAFFGVVTFIPLFIQAGLAGSIDDSRNILNALLIPMIVGAVLGGQLSTRFGYRGITFAGLSVMTAGLYLVSLLNQVSNYLTMGVAVAITGFGVGITFPTVFIAIQFSVQRKHIGIGSSLPQFMGNLGATIGLAILGAVQSNIFGSKLSDLLAGLTPGPRAQAAPYLSDPNLIGRILADPKILGQIVAANPAFAPFIPTLRNAFIQSLTPVFQLSFIVSIAAVAGSLFITGTFKQQVAARSAATVAPKEPVAPEIATATTTSEGEQPHPIHQQTTVED